MHVRAVLAIARKDALEILLQKSNLFTLGLPLILTVAYVVVSTLVTQVTESPASLLVYNPGNSGLEQVIAGSFGKSQVTPVGSAAEVAAAFGPDGSRKSTPYWLGLIIPANFDADLRAGRNPQLGLFLNRDVVGPVTTGLVQAAIGNYVRSEADPQMPVVLTTAVINPAAGGNAFSYGRYYAALSLLLALQVGTAFIPSLLIDEKEKKTLRLLMVTPASFADVIAGKFLVALAYQLAVLGLVLAIVGGYSGPVLLIVSYSLLGAGFSLSLGLFLGAVLQSSGAASATSGIVSTLYILAGIFVGPWKTWLAGSPLLSVAQLFPTYYLADGAYSAWQNLGSPAGHALNLGVLLGSGLLLFVVATGLLRQQAASASSL